MNGYLGAYLGAYIGGYLGAAAALSFAQPLISVPIEDDIFAGIDPGRTVSLD